MLDFDSAALMQLAVDSTSRLDSAYQSGSAGAASDS